MEEQEQFLKALGAQIVRLRKSKNISQAELAHISDMEPANLRRVEKGRINPTIWTLRRLCRTLNITLSELPDFEKERGRKF